MPLLADPRLRAAAYLQSVIGDTPVPASINSLWHTENALARSHAGTFAEAMEPPGASATDALPVSITELWNRENQSAARRLGIMETDGGYANTLPTTVADHWDQENRSTASLRDRVQYQPGVSVDAGPGGLPDHLVQTARAIQAMSGEERVAAAKQALADVATYVQQGILPVEQAWTRTFEHLANNPGPAPASGSGGGGGRKPPDPPVRRGSPNPQAGDARISANGEKRMAGQRLQDILGWGAAGSGAVAGTAALIDLLTPDQQSY